MRALIVILALAAAAPAAAQPRRALELDRDARLAAAAQTARERGTTLDNELSTLEAREQSDRTLAAIAALGERPSVPTVPFNPKAPPPKIDASQLAEIPDAVLAASNARAVAASKNRR
ncbi:hypothetical protein [Phenylobacterium sp.]|jgi:hypothetical protein|uniref:hypothetical protein n=1 Tax=Phenylobacterium sp. TaxID=1871053 RepID=UPI002F42D87A